MYNGNHPTAKNSQKMLLDAFNELLKKKKYKDISVSEICGLSGISRQTFYTLFGTKENLVRYQLEQANLAQKVQGQCAAQITLAESCASYSEFVVTNYTQLKTLIENELTDVLNTFMFQSIASCRQSFINVDEAEREYASLFMSAGLCQLTRKYIQKHKEPNQDELAQLAYKIMSGSIYRKSM